MKRALIVGYITPPFEPAIILPLQFAHCSSHRCGPEVRLAAAVLEDAMQCLSRNVDTRGRLRREFIDARKWFWDDRCDWLFAFRSVCDLLGLDASAVRQRVQRMLLAQRPGPAARRSRGSR